MPTLRVTPKVLTLSDAAASRVKALMSNRPGVKGLKIGVKKGQPDMVEYLDGLIAQWFKDGTWDRIYNQYLGKVEGMPKAAEGRAKIPAK